MSRRRASARRSASARSCSRRVPQGKRAVLPHARVVLHQPAAQGRGAIPDLILQADELVRVRGEVEAVLARHTGQDAAKLRADTDRDRVFTARRSGRLRARRSGAGRAVIRSTALLRAHDREAAPRPPLPAHGS